MMRAIPARLRRQPHPPSIPPAPSLMYIRMKKLVHKAERSVPL